MKRRNDSPVIPNKRVRLDSTAPTESPVAFGAPETPVIVHKPKPKSRPHINKLVPTRPFPSVPRSVSATGPRSAHKEGKNLICITRKTALGAYLRRCKDLVIKDGYKTLHLSAMGAAIPHLLQLSVALPPILPFAPDEIHTQITTGTVEVQDEIVPDEEDEDIMYRTRGKSTLAIIIKIGDGEFEGDKSGPARRDNSNNSSRPKQKTNPKAPKGPPAAASSRVVLAEPDQTEMEI